MSRAINVSATRSAPVRHHYGRHEGGGKDRSQKQTRVAPVPPSQSSANLHFFSLRTHTESAYFKMCPKNILSEVSRMNKHKEGQGQEYEYVILDWQPGFCWCHEAGGSRAAVPEWASAGPDLLWDPPLRTTVSISVAGESQFSCWAGEKLPWL